MLGAVIFVLVAICALVGLAVVFGMFGTSSYADDVFTASIPPSITDFDPWAEQPELSPVRRRQLLDLEDIEQQLADGADPVFVFGRHIDREPAWAIAASLRKAFDLEIGWDGVIADPDGTWYVRLDDGRELPLGQFSERIASVAA